MEEAMHSHMKCIDVLEVSVSHNILLAAEKKVPWHA